MPKRSPTRGKPVAHRNQSHTGIWIASYVQRCQLADENLADSKRRCLAWRNTIIFKARDRDEAYRKAVRVGRSECGSYRTSDGRRARWIFEGITDLLPVYEELADGSELFFRSYRRSVQAIKAMVPRKRDLSVFDDSP